MNALSMSVAHSLLYAQPLQTAWRHRPCAHEANSLGVHADDTGPNFDSSMKDEIARNEALVESRIDPGINGAATTTRRWLTSDRRDFASELSLRGSSAGALGPRSDVVLAQRWS